jgi:hypothetical protein
MRWRQIGFWSLALTAPVIHQTFSSEHTSLCAMVWFLR